jgi:hypothetical protein
VSVDGLEISIPPKDAETGKRPMPSAKNKQKLTMGPGAWS